jgi:hypothetical protein
MRLVKSGSDGRRRILGPNAFEQLRDVGGRLEHVVERYGRLVVDLAEGRPLPDVRESVELMNSQIGYLARRLQELLLLQFEQGKGQVDIDSAADYSREIAVASR